MHLLRLSAALRVLATLWALPTALTATRTATSAPTAATVPLLALAFLRAIRRRARRSALLGMLALALRAILARPTLIPPGLVHGMRLRLRPRLLGLCRGLICVRVSGRLR
jgi:hypothetical protein